MALIKHKIATVKSAVKGERPGGVMGVFTAGGFTHSRKAGEDISNHGDKVRSMS